jgi:hypothetical protein
MNHRRLAAIVLVAAFAVFGATQAFARGHDITGYPGQLTRIDLNGYVLETTYTLGNNTGNTFRQTYHADGKFGADCVSGPFAPCHVDSNYTAMPIAKDQVMVTWFDTNDAGDIGVLNDVFLFNFKTGIVSDVAPGTTHPGSLGTVKVLQTGAAQLP